MNKLELQAIKNFDILPDSALMTEAQIVMLTSRSRASFWRDIDRGWLAQPTKLSSNANRWTVGEVKRYLQGL